jgi:alkylation response protein AidB-like acyl-CoA dehydrogenase
VFALADGARLVRCAESLAQRLASTAPEHATSATYPLENVTVLKGAGYFVAPIPEQFGGQGVGSLFDISSPKGPRDLATQAAVAQR